MKTFESEYTKKTDMRQLFGILSAHGEFLDEIIRRKPKRILEVGAGTGAMSIFLSWLGCDVVAIDNNRKIIETAQKLSSKLNGRVKFLCCDAFELSKKFARTEFDIIFSQGFFEHFKNEEIVELLKEQLHVGKLVIFSVPSVHYPFREFDNEKHLSIDEWKKILSGFIVDFKEYNFNWYSIGHVMKNLFRRKPSSLCITVREK